MASTSGTAEAAGKPPVVLLIGMAGAGKTTLMQRINAYAREQGQLPYTINLDPAVKTLPYGANIDIRDTVNYREVMKQYQLGPNGGILTALNLFATRFDKVIEFVEKRSAQISQVFVDTPGQIEIFTWSASGAVITESLAATMPTMVLYLVDTPRCTSPVTFVSNMLYACSIFYKTKLPMVVCFNKADVVDSEDYELLREALQRDDSYMSTLSQSMGLVLEEFYKTLAFASVSAVTGQGMATLFQRIDEAKTEYYRSYVPELERLRVEKAEIEQRAKEEAMERLHTDMGKAGAVVVDGKGSVLGAPGVSHWRSPALPEDSSDEGDDDEEDEDEMDPSFQRYLASQQ
eukprot:comp23478_c0_seq2/m.39252 comp23478_c0_seq2/g.39252  ORF comp23478_c0_seq2/g.39252 comp23478_c0_seq2/m.39252 type:complete len:346 (-) comp23478_c0_seq2:451-1488(-)